MKSDKIILYTGIRNEVRSQRGGRGGVERAQWAECMPRLNLQHHMVPNALRNAQSNS